ncbi:MAG TPA: PDZ domain-containing protein [Saprospiraceae bacterium]|nr:PDZ domain-containing protein [Saprospiraceae bacterium]
MNKCYFAFGTALLLCCVTGALQAQQPSPSSSGTKIIIIEEKVDRAGNKTVTKTTREGNFTDEEIEKIIEEESQNENAGNNIEFATPGAENHEPKGYLGVMIEDAEGGVRITEVVQGSPAETAGLKTSDVIMAIDNAEVANMESLVNAISSHKPGDAVRVHYRRDGSSATVSATLSEREEPISSDVFEWDEHIQDMKKHEEEMKQHEKDMQLHEKMMKEHEAKLKAVKEKDKPRFGVSIDDVEEGPGVLVTKVYEGSLAEKTGLQKGDIITSFNGIEVNSPDELIEAVKAVPVDDKVKVNFVRDGKKMKEKVTFERT